MRRKMFGDMVKSISIEEIQDKLKDKIDKNTIIYIYGHGGPRYIISSADYWWFGGYIRTSKIFKTLNDLTDDPIHILLLTCYSGAANADVTILKKGSTLTTSTEPDMPTTPCSGCFMEKNYIPETKSIHPRQLFLTNIRNFVATTNYCESLGDQKKFCYTFRPGQIETDSQPETFAQLISLQEQEFISKYKQEVSPNTNFDTPPPLTDANIKRLFEDYINFFMSPFVYGKSGDYDKTHVKKHLIQRKAFLERLLKLQHNFDKIQIPFCMYNKQLTLKSEYSEALTKYLASAGADFNLEDDSYGCIRLNLNFCNHIYEDLPRS